MTGWIGRKINLSDCVSVCVGRSIHACLFAAAYEVITFLSGHYAHFLENLPCLVQAKLQPLTRCQCEDRGMLNISELLYLEVVTHLERQE